MMKQHALNSLLIGWFSVLLAGNAMNSFASVQWEVKDGGWCDLVILPIVSDFENSVSSTAASIERAGGSTVVTNKSSDNELKRDTATDTAQTTIAIQSRHIIAQTSSPSEDEFTPLFNGTNLDGWIIQGMEKAGPTIENGVMTVGGWDYWAVITRERFKNFILRFDVKFEKAGNSGILIHTPYKEVYKHSFEIQIADNEDYKPKQKPPEQRTGGIFGKVPPIKDALKPLGEWNSVEIKYIEPAVWVAINGELVLDGIDTSTIQDLKHTLKEGSIAIQRNDYKKPVHYKNIRIKRLPD